MSTPGPQQSVPDWPVLPDDPDERAVAELAVQERRHGRARITIGPLAAYLIGGALRQAVRAPGVGTRLVVLGTEVANSARDGMDPDAREIADRLDALSDALGPDGDAAAAPEYVDAVRRLREMETLRENAGTIELGPYSSFVCIGLLQMVTRHPEFGPDTFAHDVIVGFARQMQAPYDERVRALIEQGFDPANDYA